VREFSRKLFPPVAAVLAVLLGWLAWRSQGDPWAGPFYLVPAGVAVLLGGAAVTLWFGWRRARSLAFLSGIALCLLLAGTVMLGVLFQDASIAMLIAPVLIFVAIMAFAV